MKTVIQKIVKILIIFAAATVAGFFLIHYSGKTPEFVVEKPILPQEADRVVVQVDGAVKEPGEYSVIKGTSLHDVLHGAGGVEMNADLSGFDFDTFVCENCTITVPEKSALSKEAAEFPVDINNATAEDFSRLNGIGDKLALQIINYRNLHGNFKSTDELMNVKGIGKNKYEAIKDMITVGGN